MRKLSDVVENDVVKKTEYDELVKNVNNIKTTDTSDVVENADYDYFGYNGSQNYLVFQPFSIYFTCKNAKIGSQ